MSATLRVLDNVAREAPEKCLRKLLAEIDAGTITPYRVVIVVDDAEAKTRTIRAGGAGMEHVPMSIGLLFAAANDLANATAAGNGEG
jgi:hypothetical protein